MAPLTYNLLYLKKEYPCPKIGACVVGLFYRNDVAATYIWSECFEGLCYNRLAKHLVSITNESLALRLGGDMYGCFRVLYTLFGLA